MQTTISEGTMVTLMKNEKANDVGIIQRKSMDVQFEGGESDKSH
jgi:hypothetical protein